MNDTSKRRRPIVIVGGTLLALTFAGFMAARLTSGPPVWLNAWHQPVSVFLLVPVLAIILVIGLLSHFIWRPSRPPHPPSRGRR